MPHFLALDWDEFQCRYILAAVGRNTVSVQKAGTVDWSASPQTVKQPENSESVRENRIGNTDYEEDEEEIIAGIREVSADDSTSLQALCSKLKELKLSSCRSLLSLGRGKTEILYQKLPPCKESELPVLLKNQVLRELPNCTDFDPLDYLPLSNNETTDSGWNLLALTIPLSYRQLLTRSFRGIHFAPQQISFRAAAAASLFLQYCVSQQNDDNTDKDSASKNVLLVNITGLDADLVLTDRKQIVSIRSFRLPSGAGEKESAQRTADEVSRTVLTGLDSGGAIQKIAVFGSETEHCELKPLLDGLSLETEIINPLTLPWVDAPGFLLSAGVSTADEPDSEEHKDAENKYTENKNAELLLAGRFAPLVGLLSEQMSERKEQVKCCRIDFLHPREAPKPVNLIRTLFLSAVVLIIVSAGLYFWNREVIKGMEKELAKLQEEYKETAAQYKQIQPIFNVLRQTQYWDSQNVAWLDELRALSVSLPAEQDLVISQMTFTAGSSNPKIAGTIQLNGLVRDPSVLWTFQRSINSGGFYQMRNPQISRNPAGGGYPYLFQTVITKIKR
ncbi:hypothetical protein FACS189427_09040 [Planctomycetales bacterium]|nr:hypothetical protein FACS189427_09040 [Planctomycetales bacterium]